MPGLIFLSPVYKHFIARIDETCAEGQYSFRQGLYQVMTCITERVMRFAPLGVFGLMTKVVAGLAHPSTAQFAQSVDIFFVTVILA